MGIKNVLKEHIKNSLNSLILLNTKDINIKVEKNIYTTDIAIIIFKKSKISINDIYKKLEEYMKDNNIIKEIYLTDNNLISLRLSEYFLKESLLLFLRKNHHNNEKVIIKSNLKSERITNYTQLRNIIYNDNLSRIKSFLGKDVLKEYYFIGEEDLDTETLKKQLDILRIYFDSFTSEKKLLEKYLPDEILAKIRYTKYCYVTGDELYFKDNNIEQKLINSSGFYNPIIYELAYDNLCLSKNFHEIINIASEDYIKEIRNSNVIINCLFDKKIDVNYKICPEFPMEECAENIIDYLHNFGVNEFRFLVASLSLIEEIEQSKMATIMYSKIENTYIKIYSILKKNKKLRSEVDFFITNNDDITYNILNKLVKFEDLIIDLDSSNQVNKIPEYIISLSNLTEDYLLSKTKINIELGFLLAIKKILDIAYDLIGVIPKEEK